jgi:hypothetical protein
MYSLRCDRCGWQEEMDSVLYTSCPNCHNQLIIENYGEDIDPTMLETKQEVPVNNMNKHIKYMRTAIDFYGNDIMWIGIESKPDYKVRIKYRQLFLMAGGTIPQVNTI